MSPGWRAFALVAVLLPLLVLASLLVGAGYVEPGRALDFLLGEPGARADAQVQTVVVSLRLPRTIVAVVVGLALGLSGALLQAVTRNPLAEAGLLGINAGAALAIVVGITYTGAESGYAYLSWALAGALIASFLVLGIASVGNVTVSPLRLVLAGAALGATFRGLAGALLIGNQATFDRYRFWVLGSLSGVTTEMALQMLPVLLGGMVLALLVTRPLSALALGDDIARSLGHRPGLVRVASACAVTLLVATAVALVGPIAFLGLVAPHLARSVVGPRMASQLLLSSLAGAALLLAADVLARVVVRPYEAPASVLLAIVGAPMLIWIARSRGLLTLGAGRAG